MDSYKSTHDIVRFMDGNYFVCNGENEVELRQTCAKFMTSYNISLATTKLVSIKRLTRRHVCDN